ncbi:MAG: GGDEF domain-containing protein [Myxococcales bacterium]|nr:GGDEF domain-containing protein [Myxococcales bacterium]MCB9524213.1 GGDEF domain-containing protein [Myxococcales bacterium]
MEPQHPHLFQAATGEFASAAQEALFQAEHGASRQAALRLGLAIGAVAIGLGVVGDYDIAETRADFLRSSTTRGLVILLGCGLPLVALRQPDGKLRAALIAVAEVAVAVGFLTIRATYDDRAVPGSFLVTISGLLTGVFFFLPNRLRWQVAAGVLVTAVALVGARVLLGRSPGSLIWPGLVYGVLVVVGWRLNRAMNRDQRLLFLRQQDAEAAVQRASAAERTALALFRRAPTAMVVVAEDDGRIMATNAAFDRLVQANGNQASMFDRMLASHRGKLTGALEAGEQTGPVTLSLAGPSNASVELQARADAIEHQGVPALILSLTDERPQRLRERALRDLAERDPLTGALNRRGFEAAVDRALAEGGAVGLMLVDVDRFKAINDVHGHPVGDRVLAAIVQDILALVRRDDLVGRLGGDEFAVLLVEVGPGMAVQVADRLRRVVGREVEPHTTISIGLAQRHPNEPYADLFGRADAQLYAAKAEGGNRVSVAAG